jgi:hypothetical protein
MTLFRTNPAYVAITAFLFLQIPILIAGNSNLPASKRSENEYLKTLVPAAKTEDEIILHEADSIYAALNLTLAGLGEEVFELAYKGYYKLLEEGVIEKPGILTIADFSKSSSEKRLYILDIENQKILFNTLVAHGRKSGLHYATDFSNKPESNKSSLGFYVTMNTYYGDHGLALKLKGLEKGINDMAFDRAIVMHGSDYVSSSFLRMQGYLGRSFGCPAIPMKETPGIINTIKNGSLMFIYHPTKIYLNKSEVLNS